MVTTEQSTVVAERILSTTYKDDSMETVRILTAAIGRTITVQVQDSNSGYGLMIYSGTLVYFETFESVKGFVLTLDGPKTGYLYSDTQWTIEVFDR